MELLVVVVIIAVLAAIAVPIFLSQKTKAQLSATLATVSILGSALAVGQSTEGTVQVTATELIVTDGAGAVTHIGLGGVTSDAVTVDGVAGTGVVAGTALAGKTWCVTTVGPSGDRVSMRDGNTAPIVGGAGCTAGSGGGAPVVSISYQVTGILYGSNNDTLTPTVTNGTGTPAYTLTGTLPPGVTFSTTTGVLTGVSSAAWKLTYSQIAAGKDTMCGVLVNSTVKCWGKNNYGQVGNGTNTTQITPDDVKVTAGGAIFNGVTSLGIGSASSHACAVMVDTTVKCWGWNNYGQLGDETLTNSSVPVNVNGLSGVTQITTGLDHTCALITGGTVKCWGRNNYGQLGDGTLTTRATPVLVSGLTDVTSVSASQSYTCAVITGGAVKCWGINTHGQVGDGTKTGPRATPTSTGLSNVIQLSTGLAHSCVLFSSGEVSCWGQGSNGNIGDGTLLAVDKPTPVFVLLDAVTHLSNVTKITVGGSHTCAVLVNKQMKCWGLNSNYQLSDGTNTSRAYPVDVLASSGPSVLFSNVSVNIAAGMNYTCTLNETGMLYCWGDNTYYQVKPVNPTSQTTPYYLDNTSSQPGFPVNLTVRVDVNEGFATTTFSLTVR